MNRFKKLPAWARSNGGSAIVGVLAALVFIGIVAGFMVKNTGAQSAASVGYASALTMHSTAQSGIVATEGFFLNNAAEGLKFIDTLIKTNGVGGKFVNDWGKAGRKKRLSPSSDQYFSSAAIPNSIVNLINKPDSCLRAGFLVAAGKNAKGKELRTGRAFLQFENLKQVLVVGDAGAKNAVYSRKGISNADAGLTVKYGKATFMEYAKFQNAAAVFDSSVYFAGGAYFMKDSARFKDEAYFMGTDTLTEFHVPAIFDSMVYFNGRVKFQSTATFKKGAYFMDVVTFQNGAVSFADTAYFKSSVNFASNSPATFQKMAYFTTTTEFNGTATFTSSAPAYFGGSTRFKEAVTFANMVQFDGDATFDKNVTFLNKSSSPYTYGVYFGGDVVFGGVSKFYTETYFKKTVKLSQNNDLEMYHRVGFDGTINLNNRKVISGKDASTGNTKYDVFIRGLFSNPNQAINASQSGIHGTTGISGHSVYYSLAFQNAATAANKWLDALVGFDSKGHSSSIDATVFGTKIIYATNTLGTVPDIPPLPLASDRKDPELSIQPVYDAAANGVKIYNGTEITSNGSDVSMTKLINLYNTAIANPSNLYNGTHMVIEITSTINFNVSNEKFDANIIYIIKSPSGKLNANAGGFYSNTSDNATTSTLIYVGAGTAQLEQFGTVGTFRGFIYIDAGNTISGGNSIHFKDGSATGKIIGAVHNFATVSPFYWNTGKSGYSTPIEFDASVLAPFAPLYPASGGTASPDANVTLKVVGDGIVVKTLGVYFH